MKWIKPKCEGYFDANTYIFYDEKTGDAAIVDPSGSADIISKTMDTLGVKPMLIILTHGHFDHIASTDLLRDKYSIPVAIHTFDAAMLSDPSLNLSLGLTASPVTIRNADILLSDNEMIKLGGGELEVLHTPGHTQGGITLYAGDFAATGDAIFCGSVGRTDFPGGDMRQLIDGIREKILTLPDETVLLPGHDKITTVYDEKKYNAFVRQL